MQKYIKYIERLTSKICSSIVRVRKNLEFYVKVTTNICYKITVCKKLMYSVNSGLE